MLLGTVLGAIIVLLAFAIIFLLGKGAERRKQLDDLRTHAQSLMIEGDKLERDMGVLAAKVQEMQKPVIIHFNDDQMAKLAFLVMEKVQQISDSQLNKLN